MHYVVSTILVERSLRAAFTSRVWRRQPTVLLQQATKEAEYRERVADLKTRIDSCTARVNAEEEQVNTAKVLPALGG